MRDMSETEYLLADQYVDLLGEIRSQQADLLQQVDVLNTEYSLGAITRKEYLTDRAACYAQINELDEIVAKINATNKNNREAGK